MALAAVGTVATPALPAYALIVAPSPQRQMNDSWHKATTVGEYHYRTSLVQTMSPLPKLENVGLSNSQERIYIEGETSLPARTMYMKLWSGNGNVPAGSDAIEIKVADGKAQGRVGEGDWKPVDDVSDIFAPNGDVLTYLAAATNVAQVGQETRAGTSFTRLTFDIDGRAFAEHMREHLEAELQAKGKLPIGLSLDVVRQYVDMTGQGELWVGDNGLPLRQIVHLKFPSDGAQTPEAEITTDFSGWSDGATPPAASLEAVAGARLPGFLAQAGRLGMLVGAMAALVALIVIRRRSRHVYRILVVAVIGSMTLVPFLQAQQVYAFTQDQQAQRANVDAQRETQRKTAEAKASASQTAFDPHVDPVQQAARERAVETATGKLRTAAYNEPVGMGPGESAAQESVGTGGPDSDGDGLADAYETNVSHTNPQRADSDGDGLSDGLEVLELGTNPSLAATAGDGITDSLKVRGFTYNGQQWYLNPLDKDTNHDGRPDSLECSVVNGVLNCPDTDGDGTPDVWDQDDDNDGVPDAVDTGPTTVIGGGRNTDGTVKGLANGTFDLSLQNQSPNWPTLVEFQLRPVNPQHLWYTLNVLDWPSDDRDGQIQRVFDTKFGSSGKDANGDIRLIPMLEIEIPFSGNGYGNLPVKSSFSGSVNGSTPLADWLDTSKLDPFGITVRKKDNNGTLLAYVPVSLVRDRIGSKPVAFSATMFYLPTTSSFGPAQHVRLAWMVQAITDVCDTTAMPSTSSYDAWCAGTTHWVTNPPLIVHSYYDDWYLTGLTVREDHGLKVDVAFEDPAYARAQSGFSSTTYYESNLWFLATQLDSSFLAARTGAAGTRDMTADTIRQRFDKGNNRDIPDGDPRLLGLPRDAFRVQQFSFEHEALAGAMSMTYVPQLLAQYFTPHADVITAPTLLFAREETFRSLTVDTQGLLNAAQRVVDMAPANVPIETIASMSWAPYQYKGAGVWDSFPTGDYAERLQARLVPLFQADPQLNTEKAVTDGALFVAASFYLGLVVGANRVVSVNDLSLTQSNAKSDTDLTNALRPAVGVGSGASAVVKELANSTHGTGALIFGAQAADEYIEFLRQLGVQQSRLGGTTGKIYRFFTGQQWGAVGTVLVVTGLVIVGLSYAGVVPLMLARS
ncbi:MAG: hypothetical protein U0822_04785 [Anaerolineae bacterium]